MDHLWKETPLVYSKYASDRLNCDVYLKLEVPAVLDIVGLMFANP